MHTAYKVKVVGREDDLVIMIQNFLQATGTSLQNFFEAVIVYVKDTCSVRCFIYVATQVIVVSSFGQ